MGTRFSGKRAEVSEVPALILAGGLGTRLRPVFDSGPKSMAPVGGRPFLEYLMLQISRAGFRDVLLCVGYGRTQVEEWAGEGKKWGLRIRYSVEPKPLGTAGAVKLATELIDSEAFLVFNGDSFLSLDLRELVQEHFRCQEWATIALARVHDATRYGTVVLNPEGKITAFLEKHEAHVDDSSPSQLINGGIYVFNKMILNLIPEMTAVSLEREVFPQLVAKGVKGFTTDGYFIDIGLPDDFKRAQTELPQCF